MYWFVDQLIAVFMHEMSHFSNSLLFFRRAALQIWKQRLGSGATYNKLITIFENAGYRGYAEYVRKIAQFQVKGETDDSSDDEPIPQPQTYPHPNTPSPPSSPKRSSAEVLSHEEFLLVTPDAAQSLPKGEHCQHYNIGYCRI